jgi:hypothetical protein
MSTNGSNPVNLLEADYKPEAKPSFLKSSHFKVGGAAQAGRFVTYFYMAHS